MSRIACAGAFLLAAAAAEAQSDGWSGWTARRALTETESRAVRERIVAWISKAGAVDALAAFARRSKITAGEEIPVYRVAVEALVEERRLDRVRRVYEGGSNQARTCGDPDLWAAPLPSFVTFEPRAWRLPVDGSTEVATCRGCAGKGDVPCRTCGGDGMRECATCKGHGKLACADCKGWGCLRCSYCERGGKPQVEGVCDSCERPRKDCPRSTCVEGEFPCGDCLGLSSVRCEGCRMKGKFSCEPCRGKGRTVESYEILIALTVQREESTFTKLDAKWANRVRRPATGWTEQRLAGLDAAVAAIGDEDIRGLVAAGIKRGRADRPTLRDLRVSIQRVPAALVTFEIDAALYEALVSGDDVTVVGSPAGQWVAAAAARAMQLVSEGKFAAAREAAQSALVVDPRSAAAAAAIDAADRAEKEARREAERPKPAPPVPSAPQTDSYGFNERNCMIAVVAFTVFCVILAAVVLKSAIAGRV